MSNDIAARRQQLTALEGTESPDAVEVIAGMMSTDPDPSVREDAARVLGRRADRRATPALVAKIASGDALEVRAAALGALARLGDPAAVPALIDLWRRDDAVHDEGVVQMGAADALSKFGGAAAPALIGALEDAAWNVRYFAVKTLGMIGDRSVADQIRPLLADPNAMVRAVSAYVLGTFES